MADNDRNIKLYHYDGSPYARKVVWYLALRQLPYSEVKQPFVMPRPDVKAIGVAYRRIPLMAIGKDVYCDTRIILRKLEELLPNGRIGVDKPEGKALQRLLDVWHNEAGLFARGAQTLPPQVFKNETFVKDRTEMTGMPFTLENMQRLRPDALVYLRNAFSVMEDLLSDGREWLLSTPEPSLGDIEGIFVIHWLINFEGALPDNVFSKDKFPNVYAWTSRFDDAIETAKAAAPKVISLKGTEAAEQILAAQFAETEKNVDPVESQSTLRKGDQVEVFPTDSGSSHHEKGTLVAYSSNWLPGATGCVKNVAFVIDMVR